MAQTRVSKIFYKYFQCIKNRNMNYFFTFNCYCYLCKRFLWEIVCWQMFRPNWYYRNRHVKSIFFWDFTEILTPLARFLNSYFGPRSALFHQPMYCVFILKWIMYVLEYSKRCFLFFIFFFRFKRLWNFCWLLWNFCWHFFANFIIFFMEMKHPNIS